MRRARAFTIVEVMVSLAVLAIALMGMLAAHVQAMQATALAHERGLALRAARETIELLKTQPIGTQLSRLNDPTFQTFWVDAKGKPWASTAAGGIPDPLPGGALPPGLKGQDGDPDGLVGYIWWPGCTRFGLTARGKAMLPLPPGGTWDGARVGAPPADPEPKVREDVTYTPLGLPFDLNASGAVDANTDVSTNAILLPVVVVIEWKGVCGDQRVMVQATTLGPS